MKYRYGMILGRFQPSWERLAGSGTLAAPRYSRQNRSASPMTISTFTYQLGVL